MARRRHRKKIPAEVKSSGHQDRQALLLEVEQCQQKLQNLLKELENSESGAEGVVQVKDEELSEDPEPPDFFLCPISKEIMRDPVVLSATGHTFDRPCILSWFARNNLRCPMTNRTVYSITLVPNLALRSTIMEWCQQHGVVLDEPLGDGMTRKFHYLLGDLHTPQHKEALEEIHELLKSDANNMRALIEANGMEILVCLVMNPQKSVAVALVLCVLRYLCIIEEKKMLFKAFCGISAIIYVLKQKDNLDEKAAAMELLKELEPNMSISERQSVIPFIYKYYKELLEDSISKNYTVELDLEKEIRRAGRLWLP